MKAKMKILAFALSAAMMTPMAFAYASEEGAIGARGRSTSSVIKTSSGNTTDVSYSFTFKANGDTQGTAGRAKEDKSKSFIRIDTKTVDSCRVYIDGSVRQNGSRWINETS